MKTTCLEFAPCVCRPTHDVEPLPVTAARLATPLGAAVEQFVCARDQNLGHLETQVAAHAQELLRQAPRPARSKRPTPRRRFVRIASSG